MLCIILLRFYCILLHHKKFPYIELRKCTKINKFKYILKFSLQLQFHQFKNTNITTELLLARLVTFSTNGSSTKLLNFGIRLEPITSRNINEVKTTQGIYIMHTKRHTKSTHMLAQHSLEKEGTGSHIIVATASIDRRTIAAFIYLYTYKFLIRVFTPCK